MRVYLLQRVAKGGRDDYSNPMEPELPNPSAVEAWQALPLERILGGASPEMLGRRARLSALVLEARYIPCRIERGDGQAQVLVPPHLFRSACRELVLYERKNRNWPPPPPPARSLRENTLATVSVLLLLAVFYNLIQLDLWLPGLDPPDWRGLGRSVAGEILDGQWWRAVTSLTLHADWMHLASNLLIGGIFILFLCREVGAGLAWSLLLSAGVLGNFANALVQRPSHASVGASTAVFGAVGILGALSLVRYRHHLQRRWPMPVASALALLAVLGTEGPNTDIGAHLFGFLAGLLLGFMTEWIIVLRGLPGRLLNAFLALAATGVVAAAWWMALKTG